MLLTCPTCRSGLEVPDGTTAMVRCPACKTVFSPAAGLAPPEEEEDDGPRARKPSRRDEDDDEDDRPRRRRRDDEEDDDEDDRPRKKAKAAKRRDDEEEKTQNRDFDPPPADEPRKRKKRRRLDDSDMSVEEKEFLKAAFARAAIGAKLIWGAFGLYLIAMTGIIAFWFQDAMTDPTPTFVTLAGVLGGIGWVLGAVGVGLCLSGPQSPGHWGYGIAAAVVTGVHLLLVAVLAAQAREYSPARHLDPDGPVARWGLVATRLDAVTYYLTVAFYHGEDFVPKGKFGLSIVVGIFEILRNTLIMMFLSCLAKAAGDDELSFRCTRAAGYASWGPGFMAAVMLVTAAVFIETRAGATNMTIILFSTVVMGVYAVLNGCLFPAFMAAREVADALDEPFQSQIPQM